MGLATDQTNARKPSGCVPRASAGTLLPESLPPVRKWQTPLTPPSDSGPVLSSHSCPPYARVHQSEFSSRLTSPSHGDSHQPYPRREPRRAGHSFRLRELIIVYYILIYNSPLPIRQSKPCDQWTLRGSSRSFFNLLSKREPSRV